MSRKIDLGDGRWRLIIEAGKDAYGKRRRSVHTFKGTSKQADKEIIRLELEAAQDQKFVASKKPLGEFLLHWIDNIARPDLAPNTYESYRWEIEKHIIPVMGHIPLASLGPVHIQDFYSYKSLAGGIRKPAKPKNENVPEVPAPPKGLSNRTVQYLHSILNKALEKAVDLELLDRNPCRKIKPAREKNRAGEKWVVLTARQLESFLDDIREKRDYPIIFTAAYTGARQSELIGLEIRNIGKNYIRIERAYHPEDGDDLGRTKNRTSTRTVAVTKEVIDVLAAHRAALEAKGYTGPLVFPDLDGGYTRRKALSQRFKIIAKNCGYPGMTFHHLRHTHATILLSAGVNPKAVSERLGHRDIQTTLSTYTHVLPKEHTQVASTFSGLLKLN